MCMYVYLSSFVFELNDNILTFNSPIINSKINSNNIIKYNFLFNLIFIVIIIRSNSY